MYKISKIEMPKNGDWGIIQINDITSTYFRFDLINGKPKLDTSFFADQAENPEEKHQRFSQESDLYKGIEKLLIEYMKENGENETPRKFVIRGKTMKFTSTSPDTYDEEIVYNSYEETKATRELLDTVFPFELFEVEEI